MKRHLVLLGMYWIIVSTSFVLASFLFNHMSLTIVIRGVISALLALIYLILMVFFLRNRPFGVIFLPLLAPMASLTYIIISAGMFTLRSAFCAWSVIVFIFSFVGILLFEELFIRSETHRSLVHHRYVEYLRSFVWLVIFGVVGFLSWEINALGRFNLPEMAPQTSAIMGLLQLISVFSGIGFVAYAFHEKLRQIEEATIKDLKVDET
jgi:hypothetical protein